MVVGFDKIPACRYPKRANSATNERKKTWTYESKGKIPESGCRMVNDQCKLCSDGDSSTDESALMPVVELVRQGDLAKSQQLRVRGCKRRLHVNESVSSRHSMVWAMTVGEDVEFEAEPGRGSLPPNK
jgi:hypothetical protein